MLGRLAWLKGGRLAASACLDAAASGSSQLRKSHLTQSHPLTHQHPCTPALAPADFAADLAELCPGGVDVVLNSLTSPGMLAASLAVLKHGGAFIEVGKRDIWAAARVAQVRQLSGSGLGAGG